MSDKKIYRVKGVIIKKKLLRPKMKKEGIPTYRTIVMRFEKEILGVSEEDVKERLISTYSGLHKVKRSQIKIESIEEISIEDVKDLQLKKFLLQLQQAE